MLSPLFKLTVEKSAFKKRFPEELASKTPAFVIARLEPAVMVPVTWKVSFVTLIVVTEQVPVTRSLATSLKRVVSVAAEVPVPVPQARY
jgi:hypothetical protein